MDLDENGYRVIEFVDQNGCVLNLEDTLSKIRTEQPDEINQSTVYHLILDVETDGIGTFQPPTQTLCEIGWIFLKNGKEIERYTSLVKGASKLNNFPHQFTIKNLNEEGCTPKQALKRLQKIVGRYTPTVVAHNIDFDIGILKKAGLRGIDKLSRLCTLKRSIKYCKLPPFRYGHYKYPKMDELSQRLGCKTRSDHTAMGDCTALLEIFHKGIDQGLWKISDRLGSSIQLPSDPLQQEPAKNIPSKTPQNIDSCSYIDCGLYEHGDYYDEEGDPFDPMNAANWDGDQQIGFRD
uniref:Exonuclease n=1 Tax=Marseillevirus LCMAC102 TaxID=2506603 RepID=A0A481YTJ3_9VIRU|nr:MAG: exonuclease [Marseillevirus LCMAC102]